jgi:hypothetical protein
LEGEALLRDLIVLCQAVFRLKIVFLSDEETRYDKSIRNEAQAGPILARGMRFLA